MTITDDYSGCQWVENIYEKCEARLCIKQFVTFIKKQTGKSVKRLRLDQGREFGIRDLDTWTKEKKIKVKLTVTYSPEMNGIAKRTNSFVASKSRCLLLDARLKISQSFWPEAFTTAIYLLTCSLLSFLK